MDIFLAQKLINNKEEQKNLPSTALALDPSDRFVLSAGLDFKLREWDIIEGALQKSYKMGGPIYSIALGPDGERAYLGGTGGVDVWNRRKGKVEKWYTSREGEITAVGFDPSTGLIIGGSADTLIYRWKMDANTPIEPLKGHSTAVSAVGLADHCDRLVSGDITGHIFVWDLSTGQILQTWKGHEGEVKTISLLPEESHALSLGEDGRIKRWNIQNGDCTLNLKVGGGHSSFGYLPEKEILITGNDDGLQLWVPNREKLLMTNTDAPGRLMALSRQEDQVVTSHAMNEVFVWEIWEGKPFL